MATGIPNFAEIFIMKRIGILLFCMLWLASCDSTQNDRQDLQKRYKEYWKSSSRPDPEKGKALDASYKEYFLKHPKDTAIPTLLFQDADLNLNILQNLNEGMKLLDRLVKEYPNHWRAPDALYLQAFTYEQTYQNNELARQKYEEIIQKFPNHPYAAQARQNINLLGKDLNEWVKHLTDSLNQNGKSQQCP